MADPARERSVYRYFDLADSFVQILVSDAETLDLPDRPGLNRAGYRRMVIQTCMPEFRGDVEQALDTLFPDDPLMVEDLLYQLCVEVNPSLDIHEVRLCVLPESEHALQTERRADSDDSIAREHLLERLRRTTRGLERRLAKDVLGQETAIRVVTRAMRKAAVGIRSGAGPLASFLFTGRTGTGKTQLARTLAQALFGAPRGRLGRGIVRIDCSEFALAHEYSKLIGSPPGYVGHEDGGQLTEAVARNPECVVLFDEIEKAHPRMHNLLLQILEEGQLTDSKGRCVGFERCVIVLTSNAGAQDMQAAANAIGYGDARNLDRPSSQAITSDALARLFSPEFLGRIEETVLFDELDRPTVERIARKQLFELACRTRSRGCKVAFTPAVGRWVAERGHSPEYGARELSKVLQREIEPPIVDRMLAGAVTPEQLLRVRIADGALVFEVEE